MSAQEEVGYPTQGELLRFLYTAAGVLPDKHDETPGFDEKRRKKLQKTLERLAGEEGELEDNFGEMVKDLAYLVSGYIELPQMALASGEVLFELLDVYSAVVQSEGTFLSKRDTVRWLVAERWTPAAAVSVARQITRFDLRSVAGYMPNVPGWYLPELAGAEIVWPLAKVMRWIYAKCGLTATQFHYPGRKADEADAQCRQDLENAQNWLRGKHIPSAADLCRTFDRGFAARAGVTEGHPMLGPLTPLHQEGARLALFVARCTTYVFMEMQAAFGRGLLERIRRTFQQTLEIALEDTARLEHMIDQIARTEGFPSGDPQLRASAVEHWNGELKLRTRAAGRELQVLLRGGALPEPEMQRLERAFGPLAVLPQLEWLLAPSDHEVPAGFAEMVLKGEELSLNRALTAEQIDDYERTLEQSGHAASLPWMVAWLRFLVFYRREDDVQAWHWIDLAYDGARYRAGARQYRIVNHYIEMAAKQNKRLAFRKGVQWARYIGLSVRWLRDKEMTTENLDFAMAVLKRARYGG